MLHLRVENKRLFGTRECAKQKLSRSVILGVRESERNFSKFFIFLSCFNFCPRRIVRCSVHRVLSFPYHLKGAVFFDASLNMDDEEYLQPVLSSQEVDNFQSLDTVKIAAIPLVTGVSKTSFTFLETSHLRNSSRISFDNFSLQNSSIS